jgi:hypothetical protein
LFRSPLERRRRLPAVLLLAAVLTHAALPAAASASDATAAYKHADSAVVSAAKRVARCQGRVVTPRPRCSALAARLQAAGLRLSAAQRRLPAKATSAAAASRSSSLKAPALSVAGTTLSWNRVANVDTYVMVAKSAGRADRYTVVTGTKTTPAAVDGARVAYSVRTAVTGSSWSKSATIAYPSSLATARLTAPALTVSGQTLRWAKVADVNQYEFVAKVPGAADRYDVVTGTEITPPAQPGKTVRYGLRTLVDGSKWAAEVSITYPASGGTTTPPAGGTTDGGDATAPAPTSPAPTDPAPAPSANRKFEVGIVSGSAIEWQLSFIQLLGGKHARMEFDINSTVASMTPIIAAYAKAGIEPILLAGFPGRTPTSAEAANLATWAKAFGPNGTARAADWKAGTEVTEIEFGNESNQPWQYASLSSNPNWPASAAYASIAANYATKFKEASTSIAAANGGVGLLAIADTPGRWATWMDGLFKAVPNFASYVKGWIVHPYGPAWQLDIDDAMTKAAAHGAPELPIYVTEFGFATDNGNCLTDNYGWDRCMSYSSAASTLHTTIAAMRARYGSRLAAVYLYSASDLNASGATTDREAYFGALHLDRSAKGAFTTEVKDQLAASA